MEMGSDEEAWYDRASSLKSGGRRTRQVWGSSPRLAPGAPVTPAESRGRSASKKKNGEMA